MSKLCFGSLILIVAIVSLKAVADDLPSVLNSDKNKPPAGTQAMQSLPVRVLDEDGKPIEGALITPYELRGSQGFYLWEQDDPHALVSPQPLRSDADGNATIAYPYYWDVKEAIRNVTVSFNVDHPKFARADSIHVDVPVAQSPYEVQLAKGTSIDLRLTMDGKPTDTAQVYAIWSDKRSNDPNIQLEQTSESTLRLPPMLAGPQSLLVGKLDGDRLAYLSSIISFEASSSGVQTIDVPLKPVKQIKGTVDASVPRPVCEGRIAAMTIPKPNKNTQSSNWLTWAKIESDGSFTIDAWPQDEAIQIIALCEGFIGASGDKPVEVLEPHDKATDIYQRPQSFAANEQHVTIAMEPLVKCVVKTLDSDRHPVAGLRVVAAPNVGWWNVGMQLYCYPGALGDSKEWLVSRQESHADVSFNPYDAISNQAGESVLYLPQGRQYFELASDDYEVPINLGFRDIRKTLKIGEITEVEMVVQRKGSEMLGDWDKLAGVVFGCSTREGRAICALPEVSAKMDEFRTKFQDAKNLKDPKLLSEAYTVVAQAFANANDRDESLKWHARAAEQAAKAALLEKK